MSEQKNPGAPDEPDGTDEAVPAQRDDAGEAIATRRGMFGADNGGDTSGYGGLVRTVRLPGASSRPYGGPRGGAGGHGEFDEIADELEGALDEQGLVPENVIEKTVVDRAELTFHIERGHLPTVARILRDDPALRFELCTGVSGVHFPGDQGRELHAVYHLRSITHNRLIRLEVSAPDTDPHVPSLVEVYPTNDWHERETYDFFGIVFDGHPALTRIMMPDDWQGFPQRKDYPLGGIPVEYKGAKIPAPDQRRSYS
ncbi:NADH-quinone oxidoreductase subunit C [Streptomyces angustmyceticus]|uniref:NADH-quinone oxidoreductase subunit C n=1 Tax=Streptomyces angustmyceticus TaxID=285578 RepID=A0A5J4LK96_9ACTN|nr:NADH-quinone oxidoreductase subunit C [Streptomyces angustmyceticus]UAL68497.1 NADH-quinone oxidoreductase subunit C [Streptomyces angustmyceticus]GES32934.1 NADH-quinone oxidoreductase subunit C [Streptomyces angustmyceticus]